LVAFKLSINSLAWPMLIFKRLGRADENTDIRVAALGVFAKCYRGTDDVHAGRLLAGILMNDAEPNDVRRAAHLGLYLVRDRGPAMVRYSVDQTYRAAARSGNAS
jgi:hypothetical protein